MRADRGARLLGIAGAVLIHASAAALLLPHAATPEATPVEVIPLLALPVPPAVQETPVPEAATPPEASPEAEAPPDPPREEPPPPAPLAEVAPPEPPPPPRPAAPPRPPASRPVPRPAPAAAVTPAPPAPAAPPAATPAAAPAGPPPSYLQALAAALERQKQYPAGARSRRATGVAMLRFTVLRDGRVAGWQIARGTGDAELDEAVAAMIQRARLPAMPAEMEAARLEVTVPVRFLLR